MPPKSNRKGAAPKNANDNGDSSVVAPEIVRFGKLAVDVARAKAGSKEVFMRFVTAFNQAKEVFAKCNELVDFELRVCGSIVSHACTDGSSDIDLCLVKKHKPEPTDDDDDSSTPNHETPEAIRKQEQDRVKAMCEMFANLGGVWKEGLNPQLDTRLVFLNRQPPRRQLRSCTVTATDSNVLPSLAFVLNEVRESRKVPGLIGVFDTNRGSVQLEFSSVMAALDMQLQQEQLVKMLHDWVKDLSFIKPKEKKNQVLKALADANQINWQWQEGMTSLPPYPELFDTDFDITFNHHGLRNTLLLRRYITSKPAAFVGAAFIKEWGKRSGVRHSMIRLNSYALNILWSCFLLQEKFLDHIDPTSIPKYMTSEEFSNTIMSENGYVDPFKDCRPGCKEEKQLQAQVGALLVEFFKFYGNGSFWEHNVVTLLNPNGFESREAHMNRTSCEWISKKENPGDDSIGYGQMCIEDPYEENLNVARRIEELEKNNILKQINQMVKGIEGWNVMERLPDTRSRDSAAWRKIPEIAISEPLSKNHSSEKQSLGGEIVD